MRKHRVRTSKAEVVGARGQYLLFLDDDARITDGSLDALTDVFRMRPDAAIVGSKLLFPDGALKQAGGIVWRNGHLTNYGIFDDPALPRYNYVKQADFVSRTCMLVDRSFFQSAGGFGDFASPDFGDADLAFKARTAGLNVYYQPFSIALDNSRALPSHDVDQRLRFCSQWEGTLQRHHAANEDCIFTARDRSAEKRCVLVLDHYVPRPDRDAGSRSMVQFMDLFRQSGINVKFWPQNPRYDEQYVSALQRSGIETIYGAEHYGGLSKWLEKHGRHVDYALISRPQVAKEYLDVVRAHCKAKILYYGHDVHFMRIREQRKLEPNNESLRVQERDLMRLEQRIWSLSDVIYYPSEEETQHVTHWLQQHGAPGVARTVPAWAFSAPELIPDANLAERRGILYVAGFRHPPNIDGARWFMSEVLPLIREHDPNVEVQIVGSDPPPEIASLEGKHVTISSSVTDEELAQHYRSARVAIAPLRYGAGLKGKIVEAMQFGVPTVTTSIGAQGLQDPDGVLLVADDNQCFSDAVLLLLEDDGVWRILSQRSQAHVRERFSHDAMRTAFSQDIVLSSVPSM